MTQIFELFDTLLMPFSDWIQKLPIPPVRRFEKARDQLDRIVYGLIAERRASEALQRPLQSMNYTQRSQMLRMIRRGDGAEQIAATLGVPVNQVRLLMKLPGARSEAARKSRAAGL